MKKSYLLLLAFAICTSVQAQNFLGMKIKKFGISSMGDQDRVNNLDAEYFSGLSKNGFNTEVLENEFPASAITSMTCENPALRAEITVLPFRVAPNVQLNMGTSIMFNRTDGTEYSFNRNRGEHIEFNSYSHEAALDASMVYHQKVLFLHFYGGVGTNLGYTFAGHMNASGTYYKTTDETYSGTDGGTTSEMERIDFYEGGPMKNSLHQRAFLQGGISVILFKRLELGWEGRRGVGYRFNTGNPLKFTNLVSSGLSVKWNLK